MSNMELLTTIRELKEYQVMAEELAAVIDGLKDEVKCHMAAQGIEELSVDVFKVRYTPVSTTRLDSKALKCDLPDVYGRYSKENITHRLTVA